MSSTNHLQSTTVEQLAEAAARLSGEQRYELFNAVALKLIEDMGARTIVVRSDEGQVVRVLVRPSAVRVEECEQERANRQKIRELLSEAKDDLASLDWLTPEEVLERYRSGACGENPAT
jgi:hypothetical protein